MILEEIQKIKTALSDFSENSKIWVYYSSISFESNTADIQLKLDSFIHSWKSHGADVWAKGFILTNQIIILVADTSKEEVSGCSTDSSVRFIKMIESDYHLDFFNRNTIYGINNGQLAVENIVDIHSMEKNQLVFNPFFKDLEEWRTSFYQSLADSKYKRLL